MSVRTGHALVRQIPGILDRLFQIPTFESNYTLPELLEISFKFLINNSRKWDHTHLFIEFSCQVIRFENTYSVQLSWTSFSFAENDERKEGNTISRENKRIELFESSEQALSILEISNWKGNVRMRESVCVSLAKFFLSSRSLLCPSEPASKVEWDDPGIQFRIERQKALGQFSPLSLSFYISRLWKERERKIEYKE